MPAFRFSNNYCTITFYFLVLIIGLCNSSSNISQNGQKSLTFSNITSPLPKKEAEVANELEAELSHQILKVVRRYVKKITKIKNDSEPKIHQQKMQSIFLKPQHQSQLAKIHRRPKFELPGRVIRNHTNVLKYNTKTVYPHTMLERFLRNIHRKNNVNQQYRKNYPSRKRSFSTPGKRYRVDVKNINSVMQNKLTDTRSTGEGTNIEFVFICRAITNKSYKKMFIASSKRSQKKRTNKLRAETVNSSNEWTFICTKKKQT